MEPVTFQCGHCNQLMGVSSEYLGRQVQCPHCGQVVVAPAPPAAPTEVSPTLEIASDHESIFTAPTMDEDIFGDGPPRQEISIEVTTSLPPDPALERTTSLPPEPPLELTTPYAPAGLSSQAITTEGVPSPMVQSVQPTTVEPAPSVTMPWLSDAPAQPGSTLPPSARKAARGSGVFSTVLMIPLISYAILSTALLVFLYNRYQQATKTDLRWLEELPDINGDRPGVKKGSSSSALPRVPVVNKVDLPANLIVKLKDTLTIGDVAVTPLRVENKVVNIFTDGFDRPEPLPHPCLVLHLRVKNLSSEFTFAPLDAYFDRRHDEGVKEPWTFLEPLGTGVRFFGGPATWRPETSSEDERIRREWVEGRTKVLPYVEPGEELTTFICTDGTEDLQKTIQQHKGQYRWRVHVRRGPVEVPGRPAPVPVSTIIGVEFDARDIGALADAEE
jgi:hypothetical protein